MKLMRGKTAKTPENVSVMHKARDLALDLPASLA
jgi:hypothetical protein